MAAPDYFIATGKEAFEKCKQYTTIGIVDLSAINNEDFIERWDKLKKKFLEEESGSNLLV